MSKSIISIIAVDFDGTLCENKWPNIGAPNKRLISYLIERQKKGDRVILWTCRVGDMLEKAVAMCQSEGLIFDAVNQNLPDIIESFGSDTRKIFADEYIDDRSNSMFCLPYESDAGMSSWAANEVEIACAREREMSDDPESEWDYGCACYESALTAFNSLCSDNHSGMSIGFTKSILNRLLNAQPLTPIEDTPDVWNYVSAQSTNLGGTEVYQCKRMRSLFKYVYSDGSIKYRDVASHYCVNINNPHCTYHSGLVQRIIDEMFPITLPYMPCNQFKVYCNEFLTDRKNGDFDTVGIFYILKADGEKKEINRYFKEGAEDWEEIDVDEYKARESIANTALMLRNTN